MDIKILVVDNDKSMLKNSESVLNSERYAVDYRTSPAEAEAMLNVNDYALMLVYIPECYADAVSFIRTARGVRPSMRIVAASDMPSQESLRAVVAAGARNFLKAPIAYNQLIAEVKKAASDSASGRSCCSDITPDMLTGLDEIIKKNKTRQGALIPVLQEAQELIGYLPVDVLKRIASGLGIPESEVHGVVSFYSFFTMKPKGRHNVRVCLGTACYVKGADEIVKKIAEELKLDVGGMTEDKKFSLETVRCLGACGLAPVVVVGKETFGDVHAKDVMNLLKQFE
ncbi:MAG: NAD(P)H-dependent oxidoreductase subunit E [Dissulfurispiraceae bacterium]|nr:NAD(P)H-dependent oxidoreductase subunit E [Dissulfurispiraceae bacterium]